MSKSATQIFKQGAALPALNFAEDSGRGFAFAAETEEISIVEKISEKLNVKVRFNRLKKRMRSRSSNIL